MMNETQTNACRCAQASCGCSKTVAERCTCGERCECQAVCNCGESCDCKTAK